MKKFGIFILGFITGIACLFMVSFDSGDNNNEINGLQMLEEKGKCITSNSLKVFQTLGTGVALAEDTKKTSLLVLLLNDIGTLYYDGQGIEMPAKKCAKQVGTYTYMTKAEIQKTVPAVIIE